MEKKGCDYFKLKGVGPKAAFLIAKKYLGDTISLLGFLNDKKDVKRTDFCYNPVTKFLKAYLAFKMGVVIVPMSSNVIHQNVS
jgi:hypothetical protein